MDPPPYDEAQPEPSAPRITLKRACQHIVVAILTALITSSIFLFLWARHALYHHVLPGRAGNV